MSVDCSVHFGISLSYHLFGIGSLAHRFIFSSVIDHCYQKSRPFDESSTERPVSQNLLHDTKHFHTHTQNELNLFYYLLSVPMCERFHIVIVNVWETAYQLSQYMFKEKRVSERLIPLPRDIISACCVTCTPVFIYLESRLSR